jgi:hypothetical protein
VRLRYANKGWPFGRRWDGVVKRKTPKLTEDLQLTRENTAKYPWKFADGSVQSAKIEKVLEFISGKDRPRFFEELYRILTHGGTCQVAVPYWSCAQGIADYSYEWPPWTDDSFGFFNKAIREKMGINGDRNIKCDFDYTGGYAMDPALAQRAQEAQQFGAKHYTNAILAVVVTLTKAVNK